MMYILEDFEEDYRQITVMQREIDLKLKNERSRDEQQGLRVILVFCIQARTRIIWNKSGSHSIKVLRKSM